MEEFKQKTRTRLEEDYNKAQEVLKGKNHDEIIKIAEEKCLYNFQYMEGYTITNDVSYLFKNGADALLLVQDRKLKFL